MNKFLNTFCLTLLMTVTTFGQNNLSEGPYEQLIIRGATLINGNGAPPQGPVDIVIEKNRIVRIVVVGYPGVAIDPEDRPELKTGGRELQAAGMYVLPGFVDMHGHIGGTAQGAEPDYVFKLWMGHGITTVREPSGRGVDFSMDLKRKSEVNSIIAPRLFVYTGFGQGSKDPISSPEQAREWVAVRTLSAPQNRRGNGSGRTPKKGPMGLNSLERLPRL
jgi:hypothetical protein